MFLFACHCTEMVVNGMCMLSVKDLIINYHNLSSPILVSNLFKWIIWKYFSAK